MEKMFNFISVIGGLVGGFIVSLFGGWDVMLYTILLFAILDYFTGILKAVYKKELSSAIGFKGIVKKYADYEPQKYWKNKLKSFFK